MTDVLDRLGLVLHWFWAEAAKIWSCRFAYPWVLFVALLAALFVLALHFWDRARRRQLTNRLGDLSIVSSVIATRSPGRRLAKTILVALALFELLAALARPQIEGKRRVEVHGLDLVVAVDVSKSMLVDDVGPTALMTKKKIAANRLERARELATWVIDELPGDRIAPVVFAGAASHFPLTDDHEVAVRFLSDLGPADLPQGSNLDEVLRVSRCVLRPDLYDDLDCSSIGRHGHGGDPLRGDKEDKQPADEDALVTEVERGKAIAIFTDGGEPDPATLAEVAKCRALGIAVFFIGFGTQQGGVVYEIDQYTGRRLTTPKHDADGKAIMSHREDDAMRQLAEAAGDPKRYIVASETGELDPTPLVNALRAVNRGLATKHIKERTDYFEPFLFTAFLLLLIEAAISTRRRRVFPEAR
ncbi:MAG TPA: VWA domain-containing protein [Kofleriaceae bacterium]|jgi:Ca-activated chloride channel family protein